MLLKSRKEIRAYLKIGNRLLNQLMAVSGCPIIRVHSRKIIAFSEHLDIWLASRSSILQSPRAFSLVYHAPAIIPHKVKGKPHQQIDPPMGDALTSERQGGVTRGQAGVTPKQQNCRPVSDPPSPHRPAPSNNPPISHTDTKRNFGTKGGQVSTPPIAGEREFAKLGKKSCQLPVGGMAVPGAKTKKYIKVKDRIQPLTKNNHYRGHLWGMGKARMPNFVGEYHRPPLTVVDSYDDEYTYDDYWY